MDKNKGAYVGAHIQKGRKFKNNASHIIAALPAILSVIVVLLFAGFMGYGALASMFNIDKDWISKKDVKKGEESQNELQALKSSDEYKRTIEENKEYIKAQRELSDKWHKAWFKKDKGFLWKTHNILTLFKEIVLEKLKTS